jgi:branched-chain amino acid transport system permease protein
MATETAPSAGFGDRLRQLWRDTWGRLPRRARSLIPALLVLALAALYPVYYDSLPTAVPVIQNFPSVSTAVIMIVFMMMAVGLNIVVGYCGLLDLGYVAFYAVGAYTAGWFASVHF